MDIFEDVGLTSQVHDFNPGIAESGLFLLPESLKAFARKNVPVVEKADTEAENEDPVAKEVAALENFLAAPFSEIAPYARYVSNMAEFGTHQGVKGLEFDRAAD